MEIASKSRGACAAAIVSLGLLCTLVVVHTAGEARAAGSDNGAAGQIPAFYEGRLFTINDKELPANASASLIAHRQRLNEIYATNDLDDEQDDERRRDRRAQQDGDARRRQPPARRTAVVDGIDILVDPLGFAHAHGAVLQPKWLLEK